MSKGIFERGAYVAGEESFIVGDLWAWWEIGQPETYSAADVNLGAIYWEGNSVAQGET